MKAAIKDWPFTKGANWVMHFVFKNRDLTGATVRIVVKHINGTAVFDSADESTFKVGNSGVFSVTFDGDDSTVLFDISYQKTGNTTLNQAYKYDVEITESGTNNPWIKGLINVDDNT